MGSMARFALRHWTAIVIILAILGWAVFYLPDTPSYAIVQLKRAIDARDGTAAALYIDFPSVVKHAGYEMVQGGDRDGDTLGQLIGKGAVELLSKPMAMVVESWAEQQVDNGARDVQMPAAAVLGAIVTLHREGNTASTRFRDNRGRVWEVRLQRNPAGGRWQIVEVKDVRRLLQKLETQEAGRPADGR
jgi:hypothetical protein